MTESLRTTLVSILSDAGVEVRLSEDEAREFPFVTYEMTVTPVSDKDGVRKYVGDTYVRVVSDDFGEADGIRETVEAAIEEGMGRGDTYTSRLINSNKDCVSDIWTLELYYTLSQYS